MGSCASKPKYVDYDPQMKKKNEEHEVKQEDGGGFSPTRRSGSRPSLGILFQKERHEQGELLTQQVEKLKIPNPSANVLVSDKLENSGACATQSVVIEDQVKPTASLTYAKEVPEEPLNHETLSASLDSSSTTKAEDVGTNLVKINDLGLPTATEAPQSVEVSDVAHVENLTGVESCMTAHDSENQLMTVDTASERGDFSSSLRADNLDEEAKNCPKPGTELPVVDIEDTSDDVEDNNLGTKISAGHEDKIQKSQDSEVKMSVNDYQTTDVEDEVLGAISPAKEIYVLNTTIENTCQSGTEASPAVGDYISNASKDKTFSVVAIDGNYVAEDDSGNSLKSETMISNDVNHTSGEVEDKEANDMKLSIENDDAENYLQSGSKSPVVDNLSSLGEVEDKEANDMKLSIENHDAENYLQSGSKSPVVDNLSSSGEVEDKEANDMKLSIEKHDAENYLQSGIKSPVVDNLCSFHDVADHKVGATQQGTIDNDCGNDARNSLKLEKEVPNIDLIHSSNNAQDADLDVTMPIKGSGQETCISTDNTDAVPVEDQHSNSNTLETIEDDHSNSLTANREEQISERTNTSGNELDAIKPIDGFKEEPSSKTQNTDVVPVEYHRGNSVSTTEEQLLECKKASVAESVDFVVPTRSHVSSVVEESVLSEKEPGERSVTETVETEGLHRQVEEVAVGSQSDTIVTKEEAETTDVVKNANQDNECSQVHQEELTENKHLPVLESASEGNRQASSTDFAKELAENDKVPNVENVEGALVNNTPHVKDEL